MRNISFTYYAGLALILASGSPVLAKPGLELVGHWDSGTGEGTEVISVQGETARAALTNSAEGTITILDLSDPAWPMAALVVDLGLGSGEGATSVAFHPEEDYFIVVIEVEGTKKNGRIEIRRASDGKVLKTLKAGSEPDAVVIDREGEFAVISNEGESFSFDRRTREFDSPPGSVTIVDLRNGPKRAKATQVPLTGEQDDEDDSRYGREDDEEFDTSGLTNWSGRRYLERGVDLDGDGEIADEFEDGVGGFDEDGKNGIEDRDFLAGYIDGHEVWGNEEAGELVMIPLLDSTPKFLEPELAAFSKDGDLAYVVLQENNGVAVIDVEEGELLGFHGLGTTMHDADILDDGFIEFVEDALYALREPDGIAVTPDGRYFVTADEGDTDPKASKTDMPDFATAGGRTVSVFDAETGMLLGDTGNQIDLGTADGGQYPDGRSDSKGSEPENLVTFRYSGTTYAAVGLERADCVALVSLANPAKPKVISIAPVNDEEGVELGSQAPEGIGYLKWGDSLFVYAASEKSGRVSVFEVTR